MWVTVEFIVPRGHAHWADDGAQDDDTHQNSEMVIKLYSTH